MKNKTLVLIISLLLVSFCVTAQFTPGNLVVVKTRYNKTSSSEQVVLIEYSTSGVRGDSVVLPTTQSLPDRRFVLNGESADEGLLTLSTDGRYLILAGYDTTTGVGSVSGTRCKRIIARIDKNKNINTATSFDGGYF